MKRIISNLFIGLVFIVIVGCQENKQDNTSLQSPINEYDMYVGTVNIHADPSNKVVLDQIIDVFENKFKRTKVNVNYAPQEKLINLLLSKNANLILINRQLSDNENNIIINNNLRSKVDTICWSTFCFISHLENSDTLNLDYISKQYQKIHISERAGASFQELKGNLLNSFNSDLIFSSGSDSITLEKIKRSKDAIGIVPFQILSDNDNYNNKQKWKEINVIKIWNNNLKEYYHPSQNNIANNSYPIKTPVIAINQDAKVSTNAAFVNFMQSEQCQRIILKSGLLPFKMPSRKIEIVNN